MCAVSVLVGEPALGQNHVERVPVILRGRVTAVQVHDDRHRQPVGVPDLGRATRSSLERWAGKDPVVAEDGSAEPRQDLGVCRTLFELKEVRIGAGAAGTQYRRDRQGDGEGIWQRRPRAKQLPGRVLAEQPTAGQSHREAGTGGDTEESSAGGAGHTWAPDPTDP